MKPASECGQPEHELPVENGTVAKVVIQTAFVRDGQQFFWTISCASDPPTFTVLERSELAQPYLEQNVRCGEHPGVMPTSKAVSMVSLSGSIPSGVLPTRIASSPGEKGNT